MLGVRMCREFAGRSVPRLRPLGIQAQRFLVLRLLARMIPQRTQARRQAAPKRSLVRSEPHCLPQDRDRLRMIILVGEGDSEVREHGGIVWGKAAGFAQMPD